MREAKKAIFSINSDQIFTQPWRIVLHQKFIYLMHYL